MTKRHPFHLMMPSIYLQQSLTQVSKSNQVKPHHTRRLWTWTFIIALAAFAAALVTLLLCFNHGNPQNRVITTYVKKHPKNLLHQNEVFISVKTTGKNHAGRLQPVISTWYQLARDHTYFFTDRHDRAIENQVNSGHLVVTQCGATHSRQDLCCKMAAEFDAFLESRKK